MTAKKAIGFLLEFDQKEIVDELTNEEAGIIFKAIYEYETTREEPKLNKTLKIVFKQFKVKLDLHDGSYAQKCKKNQQNAQKRWSEENSDAIACDRMRTHANINKINKSKVNENKINKNNTSISNKLDIDVCNQATPDNNSRASHDHTHTSPIFSEVIACFNNVGIKEDGFKVKRQFNFKNTKQNQMLIVNLLDQGFTKEDIFDVIYLKYDQWIENGDKNKIDMSSYYRPGTVLGSKFEEYLQDARMKGIS